MSHDPLRILHVFRAPLGGLFRHVLDVARGQVARGHAVGIFCDASTGGARADEVLEELRPTLALGLHRVTMRRSLHPRDALAIAALTRIYRRVAPNVLHGHGSKGGAFARLVTIPDLDARTVRAYTPHGGSFNYFPGTFAHFAYMRAESFLRRRTDIFLFESAYIRDRFYTFVGSTDRLVRVVHNGIEDSEFEPVEHIAEPFDLVYIGELRAAKGVDTLIDALALIRDKANRRLTLLAVGSGPNEGELHARAKSAGIWDTAAFVPPQGIRSALARGRIMIIPSRAESLPYVILEAAAAGQPLVSTNVGGIGEIFGPASSELIAPGDPDVLVDAILSKLGEPPDVQRAKAESLRAHVRDRFSLSKMIDGGLQGYEDAFAARKITLR